MRKRVSKHTVLRPRFSHILKILKYSVLRPRFSHILKISKHTILKPCFRIFLKSIFKNKKKSGLWIFEENLQTDFSCF